MSKQRSRTDEETEPKAKKQPAETVLAVRLCELYRELGKVPPADLAELGGFSGQEANRVEKG